MQLRQAYEWNNIDPVNKPGGYAIRKRKSDSLERVVINVDVCQHSYYTYDTNTASLRKIIDSTIAAIKPLRIF